MDRITLSSGTLSVEVDPGRGSDILAVTHHGTEVDVLFRTPWRTRADAIRSGSAQPAMTETTSRWMEQYRGGWQTLLPNAGPPRVQNGAPLDFHGEASTVTWQVLQRDDAKVSLRCELFSVPVIVHRTIAVENETVRITDVLENVSATEVELDYVSHPAFGGSFLEGECTIETGARTFVPDPGRVAALSMGHGSFSWPLGVDVDGERVNLGHIPAPGEARTVFGWLTDFEDAWVAITSRRTGLRVSLEWDGTWLPYAWFWQELENSTGFPWFRRARVVAIEPSSTQTSGHDRRSALRLPRNGRVDVTVALSVTAAPGP